MTALVGVALLVQCLLAVLPGSAAAAADQVDVVGVVKTPDQRVSLAVDVTAGGPIRPESFSVSAGGSEQPTQVRPVISDRLAVALVVDGSDDGAAVLQGGLSGAANFVLGVPLFTRSALIVDTTPPRVMVPLNLGPSEVLRGLSDVQPSGRRSTSETLTQAIGQLPNDPDMSRVVLVYTSAPDAGGEPAEALIERLTRANALLAVITPATDTKYWTQVTSATGGLLVADPGTLTAFDVVDKTLRNRYLVSFPQPQNLPAAVTVRVNTAQGALTANTIVPASEPPAAFQPATSSRPMWPMVLAAVALLATAGGAVTLFRKAQTTEPARVPITPHQPQPDTGAPAQVAASPEYFARPHSSPQPEWPTQPDGAAPAESAASPESHRVPAVSGALGAEMTDDTLPQQLAVWQYWAREQTHGDGGDPMAALAANQRVASLLFDNQFHAVRAARAAGASWEQIAQVLHTTPALARHDYQIDVEQFHKKRPDIDISPYTAVLD